MLILKKNKTELLKNNKLMNNKQCFLVCTNLEKIGNNI